MTSAEPMQQPDTPSPALSRRTVLRTGAVVGTLAWVAPTVQAVSMTPAHAATTSAPQVAGNKFESAAGGGASQLPRTGTDVGPVAAAGVGAAALGAAAIVAAHKMKRGEDEEPSATSDV